MDIKDTNQSQAEQKIASANQWKLMWWRFRKHKLAMVGTIVLILFYLIALFADFLAYSNPHDSDAYRSLMPPQRIHWYNSETGFGPFVYGIKGARDPTTLKRVYKLDPTEILPIKFFGKGFSYKVLGIFKTDIHLLSIEGGDAEKRLFLLGTDLQGRDLCSRLIYGIRTSLFIGLTSVVISLFLGVFLGGISGYYGGVIDTVIQRFIEILRSIPTIPLWMALAASLPGNWSVTKVYFAITIIISLVGWTGLARVVRGRFISLRETDFVSAAELIGCSKSRIIFRHMIPTFVSHIIAATTLAIPEMIISETALSFLSVGLRAPAISLGVMLQDAQSLQALVLSPWLLIPAVPVILVVLAFNFMGDGLRDAADPYG